MNNTQDIKTYQDSLGKLTYDPRSSTGDSTEYIKTVYKYDDILKEIQENNQRGIDFSVYLNSRMEALFILELLIFVCVFFFTLIGILCNESLISLFLEEANFCNYFKHIPCSTDCGFIRQNWVEYSLLHLQY